MNESLLSTEQLKVYFPVQSGILRHTVGYIKAVDGVDLELMRGHVLGVVGESGSGKTTLGRAVLRLVNSTSGKITFENKNIASFKEKELKHFRKEAQIVFQDPFASLNPRKNIRDCIGEGLLYHGIVKTAREQTEKVAETLTLVGLSPDIMLRYPHQFSGGQQQRICIGRAIALKPKLIVCDEAVSSLDVSVQAQILNLLKDLKKELQLSYLFISHDLSVIRYLCDTVIVLYLGKVMEKGPIDEIFHHPKHPYTQALLSAIPKDSPNESKKRILLKGEIPSPQHPPSGCPFRTRCPYAQPICALPPPRKVIKDQKNGHDDHEYYCILD